MCVCVCVVVVVSVCVCTVCVCQVYVQCAFVHVRAHECVSCACGLFFIGKISCTCMFSPFFFFKFVYMK